MGDPSAFQRTANGQGYEARQTKRAETDSKEHQCRDHLRRPTFWDEFEAALPKRMVWRRDAPMLRVREICAVEAFVLGGIMRRTKDVRVMARVATWSRLAGSWSVPCSMAGAVPGLWTRSGERHARGVRATIVEKQNLFQSVTVEWRVS